MRFLVQIPRNDTLRTPIKRRRGRTGMNQTLRDNRGQRNAREEEGPVATPYREREAPQEDARSDNDHLVSITKSSSTKPDADLGATIRDGGVHFAVWAPAATSVEVEVHGEGELTYHPLVGGPDGLHEGLVRGLATG